jgi:hypothetical protein
MVHEEKAAIIYASCNLERWVKPEYRELILAALGHAYLAGTIDALAEAQEIIGKPAPTPAVPS